MGRGQVEHPQYVRIEDTNGRPVDVSATKTAFGEVSVAQPHPIFQGSFEYTVSNSTLNLNTTTNGGTVIQADAMAVVGTSTTTNSTSELRSIHHARYQAGQGALLRFTAKFTTPVAAIEQFVGLMDETGSAEAYKNGYAVGFDGAEFGIHRWQNDALFSAVGSELLDPLDGTGSSGMTIDPTKLNIFEIRFQYLGAGTIEYSIEDDSTGLFFVFHRILYANKNDVPSVYNPNFHFTMWTNNKATTSDLVVKTGSYGYFVEGVARHIKVHQPQFSTSIQEKTGVTTEVAIVTIRNKAQYASKTNFIDIFIESITAAIEASAANNLGNFRLVKNATLGGTPVYNDIEATDSVVEFDIAGTTVTGGIEILPIPLAGKNDKEILNTVDLTIILHDNETLTLAGSSDASAAVRGSMLWKELI